MTLPAFEILVRSWMNGAISMGSFVVGLYFITFWRETRQRLFVYFAGGFMVLAVHRVIFAITSEDPVWEEFSLSLRLVGYLIILAGIVDRRMAREIRQ